MKKSVLLFWNRVRRYFCEADWEGLRLNLFGGSMREEVRHLKENHKRS